MNIQTIKKIIKKAVENEKRTNSLAKLVIQVAQNNSKKINLSQAQDISQFVITYVNEVPIYIEEGLSNSAQFGIQTEMNRMIAELEQYWKLEQDLIPDNLGLIGVTDDAYASMFLLQSLSDYCQSMYGRTLLKINFKNANNMIRNIMGNTIASTLEQKVGVTISNNMINQMFNQVYQNIFSSGFTFGNAAQSYINQAEIDRQVDVQLGAMGVV